MAPTNCDDERRGEDRKELHNFDAAIRHHARCRDAEAMIRATAVSPQNGKHRAKTASLPGDPHGGKT